MVVETDKVGLSLLSLTTVFKTTFIEKLGFQIGSVISFQAVKKDTMRPQPVIRMIVDDIYIQHMDFNEIRIKVEGRIISNLGKIMDRKSNMKITYNESMPDGSSIYTVEIIDNLDDIVRHKVNLNQSEFINMPNPAINQSMHTEEILSDEPIEQKEPIIVQPVESVDETKTSTDIDFPVPRHKNIAHFVHQNVTKTDYQIMEAAGIDINKLRKETEEYIRKSQIPSGVSDVSDLDTVMKVIKSAKKKRTRKESVIPKVDKSDIDNIMSDNKPLLKKFSLF